MLYKIAIAVVRLMTFFMFPLRAEGTENVPKEGAVIIAYNHNSNLDPVMAGITCPRQLSFMAKSELFKNKLFGGLIKALGAFPVQRGTGDVGAFRTAFKIFKDGGAMLIFPEGGRVKSGQTRRAKPGVAMLATRGKVPVIPAHIKNGYRWMRTVTVVYGKPMDFSEYYDKKLTQEETQALADGVLENIYKL